MVNTNKLTLLGTGTCQLTSKRLASSVLVSISGHQILFDMGRGISSRLADLNIKQDQVENIIISHFHPDHLSDLIPYLHAACWSRSDTRTKDLNIYGPSGLQNQIFRLVSLFGPEELLKSTFRLNINEILPGNFEILKQKFEFTSLPPANNHGVKFEFNGKKYGITGDSYCHSELVAFLQGLDLVILDAGHSNNRDIMNALASAKPKIAVFSHIYNEININEINNLKLETGYAGEVILGEDLMEFEI